MELYGSPELNSISERTFRTLGEMTLAMLANSGHPKSFWWDAYVTACDIVRMMPTRMHRGWMSPAECVSGGQTANLSRLRRWGCKAYVLVPKLHRRNDWKDRAMVGYFIEYSKSKVGYRVILGDTVITSVHVLFDESMPERSADYFRELDEATVKSDPDERRVSDFDWLVGQHRIDKGLLYETSRVVVRRGLIVGFRALITAGRQQVEDKTPLHIADVQNMTEEFLRRLRKKPVSHDGDTGGGESTVGQGVTPLQPEPEAPSPSAEPASVSAGNGTKRARTPRVLTNVSTLGEVYLMEVDAVKSFLDDVDSILLTDCADFREPETFQESLDCAEHNEWRLLEERRALQLRGIMVVVSTSPGVKPGMSISSNTIKMVPSRSTRHAWWL